MTTPAPQPEPAPHAQARPPEIRCVCGREPDRGFSHDVPPVPYLCSVCDPHDPGDEHGQ